MTKTKNQLLENALEEAIEEIETEKKEIAAQIKQLHKELKDLDRKISDYRMAFKSRKKVGKDRLYRQTQNLEIFVSKLHLKS